ncbi:MAG: DUF1571 domain-containing protein [Nannocystaceae bacterium]
MVVTPLMIAALLQGPVDLASRAPIVWTALERAGDAADDAAQGSVGDLRSELIAMESAYRSVRDYTATLTKRERVKGKLLPAEVIEVKFRRPYSVYMKWTGAAHQGQEVLYVRGVNGGKLRAHPGSFPDVTVDLDPRGSMAMRGNRHPITEASLGDIVDKIVRDLRRGDARPGEVTLQDLGPGQRGGELVRCVEARFSAPGYYAPRVRVCLSARTRLPAWIQVWDAEDRLVEDYEYRDLKINVGLTDRDFAADNPGYHF